MTRSLRPRIAVGLPFFQKQIIGLVQPFSMLAGCLATTDIARQMRRQDRGAWMGIGMRLLDKEMFLRRAVCGGVEVIVGGLHNTRSVNGGGTRQSKADTST